MSILLGTFIIIEGLMNHTLLLYRSQIKVGHVSEE